MKTKTIKIKGTISTPVEMTEEKLTDMFLKWCQDNKFQFQGFIEDESKSK